MNKKVIIILAVVLCCIVIGVGAYFLVNGKNKKGGDFAIYIKQSSFGEVNSEQKSNQEAKKYEIKKGTKINLTGAIGDLEIEVTDCSEDEIKIKTSANMSIEENGVMDLVKTKNEFSIKKDEKIRLITPTMDAYDMYEIEYR